MFFEMGFAMSNIPFGARFEDLAKGDFTSLPELGFMTGDIGFEITSLLNMDRARDEKAEAFPPNRASGEENDPPRDFAPKVVPEARVPKLPVDLPIVEPTPMLPFIIGSVYAPGLF